jgi:Asp-tRNA(Asn)/Glu-tRNA(Gln) amidotransferase A subunit family amidase
MTLAVDYIDAMRARVPMRAALDDLLAKYDAIVVPTRGAVAAPDRLTTSTSRRCRRDVARGHADAAATIPAGNLAGVPALCVPNGFGANGLPTSLAARRARVLGGRRCCRSATRFQQATRLAHASPKTPL